MNSRIKYLSGCGFNKLKRRIQIFILLVFSLISSNQDIIAQKYNRGIGEYPGNPNENFSPLMKIDKEHYRNLALYRAAFASSNYDFNLTPQLITDGIKKTKLPGWIVISTSSQGILSRDEKEYILDKNILTRTGIQGSNAWLQLEMAGDYKLPIIDSLDLVGDIFVDSSEVKPWKILLSGSDDGTEWIPIAQFDGNTLPGDTLKGWLRSYMPINTREFSFRLKFNEAVENKFYKVELNSPNANSWSLIELGLYSKGRRADIGGPYDFTSAWKSAGLNEEWVYVDLGAECSFDRVVLNWIRRAVVGSIEVSNDATNWKEIALLPQSAGETDDVHFNKKLNERYVRVLMKKPESAEGYILSEMEVYGTGGPLAFEHPQASLTRSGKLNLTGGAWKLQRSSLVETGGVEISQPGYYCNNWMIATVPATVLTSYYNTGAVPDPNFGDNQLQISDSYFYSDFWYRDVFKAPKSYNGKNIFLNFDGINWKAEVFLNGKNLGNIQGAFIRKQFDVTNILIPGKENVIAVKIIKNDAPGVVKEQTKLYHQINGGELGLDNPTFHASIGWDWIPTIRGRNIGIWNDVYLSTSGPVTIENPYVKSKLPLPDTTSADLSFEVTLHNREAKNIEGKLIGKFGNISFSQKVSLNPSEVKIVKLDPSTIKSLHIKYPKLWWPNGYGNQYLYKVNLAFKTENGKISDSKNFKYGIREMTYSEAGGDLRIWVNGKRFIGKGGNWGFSESMLRYRAREYDIAVRYHKEMNFTMIRNWVGQTGDDEFYDACDKYGIMVWQDFWLANPYDGPNPEDNEMFLKNSEDFVKRIRNHPSIGLYVGRNEGDPPKILDDGLRNEIKQLDPGIHYISNSASGVVSGGGTYRAMPVKFYFGQRATKKLHSEMGMPNMVTYESLKRMLPVSAIWPINKLWGMHDFTLEGAQNSQSFVDMVTKNFGEVSDAKKFTMLAQWINYQGYRAMFEAQSRNRMGLLLWMSHSAWPSMVWQTYDYYFEPTAAYFGCKEACQPLHIQWNELTDSVEVVNYSESKGKGLIAIMQIVNLDGTIKSEKKYSLDCPIDHTIRCFKVEYPQNLNHVYFIKLKLLRGNKVVSENLYWRALNGEDLSALEKLTKIKLTVDTKFTKIGNGWSINSKLRNETKEPAVMVRLKVVGNKDQKRILPVIYSDNYFFLMPGEEKTVSMEFQNADTRGEKPVVKIEGLNIE